MNPNEKRRVLQALLTAYAAAIDLEAALRLVAGSASHDRQRGAEVEEQGASELGPRIDALRLRIDALRRDLWSDWRGRPADIEGRISRSNAVLRATVRSIRRDLELANRVAGAIRRLDGVLGIAARLVA